MTLLKPRLKLVSTFLRRVTRIWRSFEYSTQLPRARRNEGLLFLMDDEPAIYTSQRVSEFTREYIRLLASIQAIKEECHFSVISLLHDSRTCPQSRLNETSSTKGTNWFSRSPMSLSRYLSLSYMYKMSCGGEECHTAAVRIQQMYKISWGGEECHTAA